MRPFEAALGRIHGGLVLDVATGRGDFAVVLAERLAEYAQIVGADIDMEMMADALGETERERVQFAQMDAARLGFADGSFDTVSISASLHHLADPSPVLSELWRVLRPGGHLIVAEMHRDAATPAQATSVRLHGLVATVNRAEGWPHYPTLSRQQIVDLLRGLDLRDVSVFDWADVDEDPLDEETVAEHEVLLDRYVERARGLCYAEIEREVEALRRLLHDVGSEDEPRIAIIGEKPG